jgi:hypothetical protein
VILGIRGIVKEVLVESRTEIIEVQTPNNGSRPILVRATVVSDEKAVADRDIGFKKPSFKEVTDTIEAVSTAITGTLEKVKPDRASVEFGIEIAYQSGKLVALLVEGSATATLTITLEWGA